MSDNQMKELQPGQNPAETGVGRIPTLGTPHEANTGGLTGSAAWLKGLKAERADGGVASLGGEMGGGGGAIDAIDEWVVNQRGGYDKLLQQIEQNGWADNAVWKLPDGTQISVAEVRRRAAAAVSPPPPEPRSAPRAGDWRESLPPDQKQRLQTFEAKIANLDVSQLQVALGRLKQLQAIAPIEGWQSKEIQEADADLCLRIVGEKLQSAFPNQTNQLPSERLDPTKNLSEDARTHVKFLIDRFRKDKNLEKLDFLDLVAYVQAEYRKASLIGRNAPLWLLPPHLKRELLPIFGLQMEMPILQESKEGYA